MSGNSITIAPVFPLWLIILLFCLGPALSMLQYRGVRDRVGKRRALIIAMLRLGAITLLATFALNPSVRAVKGHRLVPAVAVILDTSASMGQPASPGEISRLDEARALLTGGAGALLTGPGEEFEVSLYGLSDSLRPLMAGDLARLKAGGDKGDLGDALEAISGQHSVAVLLSDGNLKWHEGRAEPLPVITVPAGSAKDYKDILIKGVKAPALAFRGRPVSLEATIKGYGYTGLGLQIHLKDQERLLTAAEVRVESSPYEETVSLSFVPDDLGRKNLSISAPLQVGEGITSNNRADLSINVVRDKTRILMVSGGPSLNYRFLRAALKRDPSIDLLSFVFLRTPEDILDVPIQQQSLIPFPAETLFLKELTHFDLVLFDNFNYSLYLSPDHLAALTDFVKGGGGLAIMGGPDLFHEGSYEASPLEEVLPIRFVDKESYRRDSPIGMRLTREGAGHPMMGYPDDFLEDDGLHRRLWQEMPAIDGINLVEAKRSSTVLLESADGIPRPILVVSAQGKGRVLVLATDYAWKWYMGMVARGEGNQAYLRLFHRMVRWLTKDPGLDPVQMILPETAPAAGREIDVRIRLHGEAGVAGPGVSHSVFDAEGARIASKLNPAPQPGEYILSFLPARGGIYRIGVETPAGRLEESLVVAGTLEGLDASPDHEQLKRIAASTGGRYLPRGHDLLKEIEGYARRSERQFLEEGAFPLWATPFALAMILGLLSSEWYLRRRWGLM